MDSFSSLVTASVLAVCWLCGCQPIALLAVRPPKPTTPPSPTQGQGGAPGQARGAHREAQEDDGRAAEAGEGGSH